MLAGLLWFPAAGQYAGSAACGECHPKQYFEQSKSGHARSLFPAGEHPLAARFPAGAGEWAFGAGDQAITFVSRVDDEFYIEHGLSYYTKSELMALTPGHSSPAGVRYRTFDPDAAILRCFSCHSTGPLRLAPGSRVAPSEPGVRCETCHGPGVAHANSQGREAVRNPARMTPAQVNDLCGACHRKTSAEKYTNWNDPWNTRHQPLYLARSRCYLESAGRLSCFTCHEPHAAVSQDGEGYSKRCKSCHEGVRHKAAVEGPCASCHMPAVEIEDKLRFANHWIGIFGAGETLQPGPRRDGSRSIR